jgi:hypothetical protein
MSFLMADENQDPAHLTRAAWKEGPLAVGSSRVHPLVGAGGEEPRTPKREKGGRHERDGAWRMARNHTRSHQQP